MTGEQLSVLEALEIRKFKFFKQVSNLDSCSPEGLLFAWCCGILRTRSEQENWFLYKQIINIHQIINDEEWYFKEDYTRELLNVLRSKNLIVWCGSLQDDFYLKIENSAVIQYISDIRRIQSLA